MGCAHNPCEEKKNPLNQAAAPRFGQTNSLSSTQSHYFLIETPKEIKTDDEEEEEEEMGEGRGMGRPSGWCICSVASSAVNSHGWIHAQRDLNSSRLHTLTFALAVVGVGYSSAPWCSSL